MANIDTWKIRVADWRASGLTASEFSAGKEFAAGTLLWWSCRLGKSQRQTAAVPHPPAADERDPSLTKSLTPAPGRKLRLARVVRTRGQGQVVAPLEALRREVSVIVEVGAVRVLVPAGVDAVTLSMVLQAVGQQAAGGAR